MLTTSGGGPVFNRHERHSRQMSASPQSYWTNRQNGWPAGSAST